MELELLLELELELLLELLLELELELELWFELELELWFELELELWFELEFELWFELALLLWFELELLLWFELELLLPLWFDAALDRRLIVRRFATARARHHSIGLPSIFRSTGTVIVTRFAGPCDGVVFGSAWRSTDARADLSEIGAAAARS